MSTIFTRWTAKLVARQALLAAARARHIAHPTADSRDLLDQRKAQVAEAQGVLGRHPDPATKVSSNGVVLIAGFEGCSLKPYQDSVGVWTIGYGHTEGVHRTSSPLQNKAAALHLLEDDLNRKYAPAVAALHLPLTQNQFDALTSFVYNLGPGALAGNTGIGKALRDHRWQDAGNEMLKWDKAGGKKLLGLTRRREAERNLFLKVY